MIDFDDVGYGFLFGGVFVGLILLALYFVLSQPVINECESKGGVIVKSDDKAIYIDKKALLPLK